MKSPFPGMDPYVERFWRDAYFCLVTYTADALQPLLPRGLRVRINERSFVEPMTQGYLEIVEVGSGNRVITVIEFLSPANKVPGRLVESPRLP